MALPPLVIAVTLEALTLPTVRAPFDSSVSMPLLAVRSPVCTVPPLLLMLRAPLLAVRAPKLRAPAPALRVMVPALMPELPLDREPPALRSTVCRPFWPPESAPTTTLLPLPLALTSITPLPDMRLPALMAPPLSFSTTSPLALTLPSVKVPPVSLTLMPLLVASRLPAVKLPAPAAREMVPAVILVLVVLRAPEALRLTEVSAPLPPDRLPTAILPPLPVATTLMPLLLAVRLPAVTPPLLAPSWMLPLAVTLPTLTLPPPFCRLIEPVLASSVPKLSLPEPAASVMLPALILALAVDNVPAEVRLTAVSVPLLPPDKVPRLMLLPLPLVEAVMDPLVAVRLPALMLPAVSARLILPLVAVRTPKPSGPAPADRVMLPAVISKLPVDRAPEAVRLTELSAPPPPPDKVPRLILPPLPLVETEMPLLYAVRLPVLMPPPVALRFKLPEAVKAELMLMPPPVALTDRPPWSLTPLRAVSETDWPVSAVPRNRPPLAAFRLRAPVAVRLLRMLISPLVAVMTRGPLSLMPPTADSDTLPAVMLGAERLMVPADARLTVVSAPLDPPDSVPTVMLPPPLPLELRLMLLLTAVRLPTAMLPPLPVLIWILSISELPLPPVVMLL